VNPRAVRLCRALSPRRYPERIRKVSWVTIHGIGQRQDVVKGFDPRPTDVAAGEGAAEAGETHS